MMLTIFSIGFFVWSFVIFMLQVKIIRYFVESLKTKDRDMMIAMAIAMVTVTAFWMGSAVLSRAIIS